MPAKKAMSHHQHTDSPNDYRVLRTAAKHGCTELAGLLIKNGVDVNGGDGCALRVAVERGHKEIVKLLIGSGALVDQNMLDAAAKHAGVEFVEELLPGVPDPAMLSATLPAAAQNGNIQLVRMLAGAGGEFRRHAGRALRLALESGHVDVAHELLDRGAPVEDSPGLEVLIGAAKSNDAELVAKIVPKITRVILPSPVVTAAVHAIQHNNAAILKLLFQSFPSDIDQYITFLFYEALETKSMKCVSYLVDRAPLASYYPLLEASVENDCEHAIKALSAKGAKVDKMLLETAITRLKFRAATILFDSGVEVTDPAAALLGVVACNDENLLKLMLRKRSYDAAFLVRTLLDLAESKKFSAMSILVDYVPAPDRLTLRRAIEYNAGVDFVKKLLDKGLSPTEDILNLARQKSSEIYLLCNKYTIK